METYIKGKVIDTLCLKLVMLSGLIVGFIAHGIAAFNKFAIHDEVLTTIGLNYSGGRWLLGLFAALDRRICGGCRYNTPLLYVLVSIIFTSLSAYFIIKLLEINNKVFWMIIAGIMVSFPMVAIGFGYMFMAPYYSLSLFFATLGASFICQYKKWYFCLLYWDVVL